MNQEDIRKLLGGYATDTLTPEEQQALFAAALEDQELFDALGREQTLRDLLRDPGAKAALLAALETPERAGFWKSWSRPLLTGLAAAGVAAIAVVAVWRGMRFSPAPALSAVVAKMKAPDSKAREPKALETMPVETRASEAAPTVSARRKLELPPVRGAMPKASTSPARQPEQAIVSESLKKEISPVTPPPPPAAPSAVSPPGQPGVAGQAAGAVESAAIQPQTPLPLTLGTPVDKRAVDARSLFYGNAFAPRKDAPAPPVAGIPGGTPMRDAHQRASTAAPTVTGNVAKTVAAPSLGVRVSVLRGDREAAVTTILDTGESVRLKLTPNEDGFLYVATRGDSGWKMVASGPAVRLQPFETPPLPFTGSGQKPFYVMLSRQAQTLSPQALAGLARTNLVETAADPDLATYVVAGPQNAPTQQVVQSITLTYR